MIHYAQRKGKKGEGLMQTQTLEVLIEENAFGSVRPVEMVVDAPIAMLVPALVQELQLPQVDIFGNPLNYALREAAGYILPENATLRDIGIRPGTKLTLDTLPNGDTSAATIAAPLPVSPMANFQQVAPSPGPAFHASETIADNFQMPVMPRTDTAARLAIPQKQAGSWTRRAVLIAGGSLLGVGAAGAAYAAYYAKTHGLLNQRHTTITTTTPKKPISSVPAQAAAPTMAKQAFVFMGHQQTVRTVSWSPDGTMLASGADDAHLLIWNTAGKIMLDIKHDTGLRSLAWSPDGQRIVTGAGTHITFFNTKTGTRLAHFINNHTNTVTSLAWTSHNQMQVVSGALDNHAIVWNTNASQYQAQRVFRLHTAGIESVSWATDGQTVASASHGGVVRVWNAENLQELHGLYLDAQIPMRAATFSPASGQLAIGGDDGVIRLWDGLNCQQQKNGQFGNQCVDMPKRLQASQKIIRSLAWSPDGRFLLAGSDDMFAIWYPAQSQKPLLIMPQQAPVIGVSWSQTKSNQIATASANAVTLWNLM